MFVFIEWVTFRRLAPWVRRVGVGRSGYGCERTGGCKSGGTSRPGSRAVPWTILTRVAELSLELHGTHVSDSALSGQARESDRETSVHRFLRFAPRLGCGRQRLLLLAKEGCVSAEHQAFAFSK